MGSYEKLIDTYAKDFKIFIDTCSVLESGMQLFIDEFIPYLKKYNNKIYVPSREIEELQKHSKSSDKRLAFSAKNAIELIVKLHNQGLVEIRGESSDNFADNVFQVVFTKFRLQYQLLLITQDNGLAQDILSLNSSKAVRANTVQVKRISKREKLEDFLWNTSVKPQSNSRVQNNKIKTQAVKNANTVSDSEKFKICTQITNVGNEKIRINSLPKEGDFVKTSSRRISLLKRLGGGGEADVFKTDSGLIAKIYKPDVITKRKHEKIKLMITKSLSYPGICYPKDIIYNRYGEFVGYLMPEAKDVELARSVFLPKLLQKKFPNWTRRDLVQLCVTILGQIQYLHDRNIILGDINPSNIMVVSPKEVYLVDTDSFQIEGFPCPVGTVNYTAPEIQGKHFDEFLRTKGNEYFAVATLLFMIMLPGKPPYAQQGGADPVSNIINMDFSYNYGEEKNGKVPAGPWRFMWSHLSSKMKEMFYCTFRKGEKYSTERTRPSTNDWMKECCNYLKQFDSGKITQWDSMSAELFPTRFKKYPGAVFINCKKCGQEVDQKYCRDGICANCRNKAHAVERCIDCGSSFEISEGEYRYLISKGLNLPKRCEKCRGKTRGMGNQGFSPSSNRIQIPTYQRTYQQNNTANKVNNTNPQRQSNANNKSSKNTSSNNRGGGNNYLAIIYIVAIIVAILCWVIWTVLVSSEPASSQIGMFIFICLGVAVFIVNIMKRR